MKKNLCYKELDTLSSGLETGDLVLKVFVSIFFKIFKLCQAGFRIRSHLIRIRIQNFRLNTDPDPDPIRIHGFDDQKFKKITITKIQFTNI